MLPGHDGGVWSVTFSPDGKNLITTSDDQTGRIWVTAIDDLLAEAQHLIKRDPPEYSADERQLYGLE